MIQRAMNTGIDASYVLMDTWFTHHPLIKTIKEQGLDVIGMVKNLKQRYLVGGERVSLNELYRLAAPIQGKKGFLRIPRKRMAFPSRWFLFAIAIKRATGWPF
jgi:hypothetical protein